MPTRCKSVLRTLQKPTILKPQNWNSALTVRNLTLPVRQWGGLHVIRRTPCARKSPQAAQSARITQRRSLALAIGSQPPLDTFLFENSLRSV